MFRENNFSDFQGLSQADNFSLQKYVGRECEITFKKMLNAETIGGVNAYLKGMIESIGNKILTLKITRKKKDYSIILFLDNITSIILL